MTLIDIKTAIENIQEPKIPTYHFVNGSETPGDKYIVWGEEADSKSTHADNKKKTRITPVTIDLYTRTEFDETKKIIETMLDGMDVAWKYNSYQYEEDTEYHHHEWVLEVILSG